MKLSQGSDSDSSSGRRSSRLPTATSTAGTWGQYRSPVPCLQEHVVTAKSPASPGRRVTLRVRCRPRTVALNRRKCACQRRSETPSANDRDSSRSDRGCSSQACRTPMRHRSRGSKVSPRRDVPARFGAAFAASSYRSNAEDPEGAAPSSRARVAPKPAAAAKSESNGPITLVRTSVRHSPHAHKSSRAAQSGPGGGDSTTLINAAARRSPDAAVRVDRPAVPFSR